MFIEVDSNTNCESSVFLRFKEIGPSRKITHVKIYDRIAKGEWCLITGWCDSPEQANCDASAQQVEDSGAGLAVLVFGGNYGVRLRPETSGGRWDLEDSQQWGEAYLLLSDERDIRYA